MIDLQRTGPDEAVWRDVCDRLPIVDLPECRRLVVVSPHPDDETLGVGGIIATADAAGTPVLIISVTAGEAAPCETSTAQELADVRLHELDDALSRLVVGHRCQRRLLHLPDGDVAAHVDEAAHSIAVALHPGDVVLAPLPDDGHPDHDAVARAARIAAEHRNIELWSFPVWAWHWHDPSRSSIRRGVRVALDTDARRRKRAAMRCYASQLGGRSPVVPAFMLARLDREFEVIVPGGDPS